MSNISIQSPILVSPLFLRIKIMVVGGLSKSYINKVLLRTPQLGFICIELISPLEDMFWYILFFQVA